MSGEGGTGSADRARVEIARVDLTARSVAAIGAVEQRTRDSRTDIINRAVQVLAILVEQADREGVTTVQLPWDDRPLHLKISRRPFPRWRPW